MDGNGEVQFPIRKPNGVYPSHASALAELDVEGNTNQMSIEDETCVRKRSPLPFDLLLFSSMPTINGGEADEEMPNAALGNDHETAAWGGSTFSSFSPCSSSVSMKSSEDVKKEGAQEEGTIHDRSSASSFSTLSSMRHHLFPFRSWENRWAEEHRGRDRPRSPSLSLVSFFSSSRSLSMGSRREKKRKRRKRETPGEEPAPDDVGLFDDGGGKNVLPFLAVEKRRTVSTTPRALSCPMTFSSPPMSHKTAVTKKRSKEMEANEPLPRRRFGGQAKGEVPPLMGSVTSHMPRDLTEKRGESSTTTGRKRRREEPIPTLLPRMPSLPQEAREEEGSMVSASATEHAMGAGMGSLPSPPSRAGKKEMWEEEGGGGPPNPVSRSLISFHRQRYEHFVQCFFALSPLAAAGEARHIRTTHSTAIRLVKRPSTLFHSGRRAAGEVVAAVSLPRHSTVAVEGDFLFTRLVEQARDRYTRGAKGVVTSASSPSLRQEHPAPSTGATATTAVAVAASHPFSPPHHFLSVSSSSPSHSPPFPASTTFDDSFSVLPLPSSPSFHLPPHHSSTSLLPNARCVALYYGFPPEPSVEDAREVVSEGHHDRSSPSPTNERDSLSCPVESPPILAKRRPSTPTAARRRDHDSPCVSTDFSPAEIPLSLSHPSFAASSCTVSWLAHKERQRHPQAVLLAILTMNAVEKGEPLHLSYTSYSRCVDEIHWYQQRYASRDSASTASSSSSSSSSLAFSRLAMRAADETLDSPFSMAVNGIKDFSGRWPRHTSFYHGIGARFKAKIPQASYPFTLLQLERCVDIGPTELGVYAAAHLPYGTCFLYAGPLATTSQIEKWHQTSHTSAVAMARPRVQEEKEKKKKEPPKGHTTPDSPIEEGDGLEGLTGLGVPSASPPTLLLPNHMDFPTVSSPASSFSSPSVSGRHGEKKSWDVSRGRRGSLATTTTTAGRRNGEGEDMEGQHVETERERGEWSDDDDDNFSDDTYVLALLDGSAPTSGKKRRNHSSSSSSSSVDVMCFGQGLSRYINHRYNLSPFGNVELCSLSFSMLAVHLAEPPFSHLAAPRSPLPPTASPCPISSPSSRSPRPHLVSIPFFMTTTDIPRGHQLLAVTYGEDYDAKLERFAVAGGALVPFLDGEVLHRRRGAANRGAAGWPRKAEEEEAEKEGHGRRPSSAGAAASLSFPDGGEPAGMRKGGQRYTGEYRYALRVGDLVWRRRGGVGPARHGRTGPEEDLFLVIDVPLRGVEQVLLQPLRGHVLADGLLPFSTLCTARSSPEWKESGANEKGSTEESEREAKGKKKGEPPVDHDHERREKEWEKKRKGGILAVARWWEEVAQAIALLTTSCRDSPSSSTSAPPTDVSSPRHGGVLLLNIPYSCSLACAPPHPHLPYPPSSALPSSVSEHATGRPSTTEEPRRTRKIKQHATLSYDSSSLASINAVVASSASLARLLPEVDYIDVPPPPVALSLLPRFFPSCPSFPPAAGEDSTSSHCSSSRWVVVSIAALRARTALVRHFSTVVAPPLWSAALWPLLRQEEE